MQVRRSICGNATVSAQRTRDAWMYERTTKPPAAINTVTPTAAAAIRTRDDLNEDCAWNFSKSAHNSAPER
jgi:hypothetical protein